MHRRLFRALPAILLTCLTLQLPANSAAQNLTIGPLIQSFLEVDAYATEGFNFGVTIPISTTPVGPVHWFPITEFLSGNIRFDVSVDDPDPAVREALLANVQSVQIAASLIAEGPGCSPEDPACVFEIPGDFSVSAAELAANGTATGEITIPTTPALQASLGEFATFHAINKRQFRIQLVVDPNAQVKEDPAFFGDNTLQTELFELLPLNADVRIGQFRFLGDPETFNLASRIRPDANPCPAGLLVHHRGAIIVPFPALGQDVSLAIDGELCSKPILTDAGFAIEVQTGRLFKTSVFPEFGDIQLAADVELTLQGIGVLVRTLTLPDNLTAHRGVSGPRAAGFNRVDFRTLLSDLSLTAASPESTTLTSSNLGSYDLWLHAEGLPFTGKLASLTLGASGPGGQLGLNGTFSRLNYVHAQAFDADDPRAKEALVSNDARFARPASGATAFVLDANGLALSANFREQTAPLHYPLVTLQHADFSVEISNGRFVPQFVNTNNTGQPDGDRVSFIQNVDCGACVTTVTDRPEIEEFAASPLQQLEDGAVMARTQGLGVPVAFGELDPNTGERTFQRSALDDTLGGIFYAPGFALSAKIDGTPVNVADVLRGSRGFDDLGKDNAIFPVGSQAAANGNYFFAGINRGPEIYRDLTSNAPVVEDGVDLSEVTGTQIYLGGVSEGNPIQVTSNAATKYVLRPAGLTGAFNTSTPSANAQVYGFPVRFDRFNFRVVENRLDTGTRGIQGALAVPGKAGIDIAFRDLELDCLGRLQRFRPIFETCNGTDDNGNGQIDEGCDSVLAAWSAPYQPIFGRFQPEVPTGDVCAVGPHILSTTGRTRWQALARPFLLRAKWDAAGEPVGDARITGGTPSRLDRPSTPLSDREDLGFHVTLRPNVQLKTPNGAQTEGWLELDTLLVPGFWESAEASVRVANQTADTAAQTIAAPAGAFASAWNGGTNPDAVSNTALSPLLGTAPESTLDLTYRWDETISFALPTYYAPGRAQNGRQPQLTGQVGRLIDLPALQAEGLVRYARPEGTTAIDFGLSADLDVLADAATALHVDFQDPESLADLDAFLAEQFGITGNPVQTGMGQLQAAFEQYRALTADGLEALVREKLTESMPPLLVENFVANAAFYRSLELSAFTTMVDNILAPFEEEYPITLPAGNTIDLSVDRLLGLMDLKFISYYDNAPADIVAAANPGASPTQALDQVELARKWGPEALLLDTAIANISGIFQSALPQIDQGILQLEDIRAQLDQSILLAQANFDFAEQQVQGMLLAECGPLTETLDDVNAKILDVIGKLNVQNWGTQLAIVSLAVGFEPGPVADMTQQLREDHLEVALDIKNLMDDIRARVACVEEPGSAPTPPADGSAPIGLAEGEAAVLGVIADLRAEFDALTSRTDDFIERLIAENGSITQIRRKLVAGQQGLAAKRAILREMIEATRIIASANPALLPVDLTATFSETNSVAAIQFDWNDTVGIATNYQFEWVNFTSPYRAMGPALIHEVLSSVENEVREIAAEADAAYAPYVPVLETHITPEEWTTWLVDTVLETPSARAFLEQLQPEFEALNSQIEGLVLPLAESATLVVQKSLEFLATGGDRTYSGDMLSGALRGLPKFRFSNLDGYAQISQDKISRLRFSATWRAGGDAFYNSMAFSAGLDIVPRERLNAASGCDPYEGRGKFNVSLFNTNIPASPVSLLGTEGYLLDIDFGLDVDDNYDVLGGAGRLYIDRFKLFGALAFNGTDFALAMGGTESWFATETQAALLNGSSKFSLNAAVILGESCSADPIRAYDPNFANFVDLPGAFDGWFVRGGLNYKVYDIGCAARAGVSGDIGAYRFSGEPNVTGGLISGSTFGEAACIASIRGQVNLLGQWRSPYFDVGGEIFGVAGAGLDCDPETWTTIPRSRRDKWCGTGDLRLGTRYQQGRFIFDPVQVGAVY